MFHGEIVTERNGETVVLQESRMNFPIVLVQAEAEAAEHMVALQRFKESRLRAEAWAHEHGVKLEPEKPPVPNLAARLHGHHVQKLGEWHGADYHYAAIRELHAPKSTQYELIHPRHLNGA